MKNNFLKYIVIFTIISGFFMITNVAGDQKKDMMHIGVISEISDDGKIIQVGSRYYTVTDVFIYDITKKEEEPKPGFLWNLKSGDVVSVYYKGNEGGNSYNADYVLIYKGKNTEDIITELRSSGLQVDLPLVGEN